MTPGKEQYSQAKTDPCNFVSSVSEFRMLSPFRETMIFPDVLNYMLHVMQVAAGQALLLG